MIYLLLLFAIGASTFTLCKAVLAHAAPFFYVATRMLIAGGLYLIYCAYKGIFLTSIKRRDLPLLLATAFCHIFLAFCADLWALQYMTSWESSFLYSLSPFISAVISICLFGKRLSWRQWLAITLAWSTMLPLLIDSPSISSGFLPLLGMLLAVASSACGWILVESLIKRGYDPKYINGSSMLLGGAGALMLSLAVEPWTPVPVYAWRPFVWQTLTIIIISNGIFYGMYAALLKKYDAVYIACAGSLCPVFTLLFGWLFLSEPFCLMLIPMSVISTVAIYLFSTSKRTK
jgi:drug/metabolite transporter (DMT)-like permease